MLRKAAAAIVKKNWADTVKSAKQPESGNKQEFSGACQLTQLSNEINQVDPAKNGEVSYKNLFADSVVSSTGKTR